MELPGDQSSAPTNRSRSLHLIEAGGILLWHVVVSGSVAIAACLVTTGRVDQFPPRLEWGVVSFLLFAVALAWLTHFSRKMAATRDSILRSSIVVHAPLAALSLGTGATMYLSDAFNHRVVFFLQPTVEVLVLLAIFATMVAEDVAILRASGSSRAIGHAIDRCSRWALPTSLVLLGLVQGSSYLWMIGNDFTRYWNVADAVRTWAGWPGMLTLPDFAAIGEPRYTIDLPLYGSVLLPAFAIFGHDTFGAFVPSLVSNALLPLLLYVFYRGARISRPVAFAGTCVFVTQPFLRLYALNTPLQETLFLTLLVATAVAYEKAVGHQSSVSIQDPAQSSVISHRSHALAPWLTFGSLAALTLLTRSEGPVLLGLMGFGILPDIRRRGPWLAAAIALVLLLPYVVLCYTTYRFLWPNNAGAIFSQSFVGENILGLRDDLMERYAEALGMSQTLFIVAAILLALAAIAGTIWLALRSWKLALLPLAGAISLYLVLMVNPVVSGIRLWFDFFRHLSYGLPYLSLAPLFFLDRLARLVSGTHRPGSAWLRAAAPNVLAVLLLSVSIWQMDLLTRPSQTYGSGGTQLLNSDVWVTIQDLAQHRYELPSLPHAWDDQGVLVIEPSFDRQYQVKHLDLVRQFFEPYSVIQTNRGSQYEISSMLLVLFGAIFAFSRSSLRE